MKLYDNDDECLRVMGCARVSWTLRQVEKEFKDGMYRARLMIKKAQRTGVIAKNKNGNGAYVVLAKYTYNLEVVNRNVD